MALTVLNAPDAAVSKPAAVAALTLAGVAWNRAIDGDTQGDTAHDLVESIDWGDATPWAELRSNNIDTLIVELVDYKRRHYPNDLRRVIATEMGSDGHIRVQWAEPDKGVVSTVGAAQARTMSSPKRAKRGPIADRIVKNMGQSLGGKLVDLQAVSTGRQHAEELQKTVATREELADLHPAHGVYVYAQNQLSVLAEQLTALKAMGRFVKLISGAEQEYMPSGPPMSPLTPSFFTSWAFFDACVGVGRETLATTVMAVGSAFGMDETLVRIIGLMQDSKMAIYAHEGTDHGRVLLRELVTNKVCTAISGSGYSGYRGELWYVRVLPPPMPDLEDYVVFTTPYVLINPGEQEWLAYFQRTLRNLGTDGGSEAYERHMKFGPARNYWSEFVFEAYAHHRSDGIFLAGLPDVPESRPHSRVNR